MLPPMGNGFVRFALCFPIGQGVSLFCKTLRPFSEAVVSLSEAAIIIV